MCAKHKGDYSASRKEEVDVVPIFIAHMKPPQHRADEASDDKKEIAEAEVDIGRVKSFHRCFVFLLIPPNSTLHRVAFRRTHQTIGEASPWHVALSRG